MTVFGPELGDLGVHLDHVEALHSVHDLLQGVTRQCASLIEDQYALTESHQRRDALDAQQTGQLRVGIGIQLGEDDPGVLLRSLLRDGP